MGGVRCPPTFASDWRNRQRENWGGKAGWVTHLALRQGGIDPQG